MGLRNRGTTVWDAATDQLSAKYPADSQAKGRGAYIVLWFGNVPGVPETQRPAHPDGLGPPQTREELRRMLQEHLPEAKSSLIDVLVIDVSQPAAKP